MYLTNILIKGTDEEKINNILSKVLKINSEKTKKHRINDENEAVNFLSEKMMKEVEKAFN